MPCSVPPVEWARTEVTFRWKTMPTGKQRKMTLAAEEFIRRFLLHVLPKGFGRSVPDSAGEEAAPQPPLLPAKSSAGRHQAARQPDYLVALSRRSSTFQWNAEEIDSGRWGDGPRFPEYKAIRVATNQRAMVRTELDGKRERQQPGPRPIVVNSKHRVHALYGVAWRRNTAQHSSHLQVRHRYDQPGVIVSSHGRRYGRIHDRAPASVEQPAGKNGIAIRTQEAGGLACDLHAARIQTEQV